MTKTGIVLLNMGGPEHLDDVRPFLFNLFSDREIIKLGPPFLQKPLAWWISKKRAPKSQNLYKQIGGRSPLTQITLQQADELSNTLKNEGDFVVVTAMRYWKPTADIAIQALAEENVDRIILLPLYPHYSMATSGSSINDFKKHLELSTLKNRIESIEVISSWPTQEQYIASLVDNIQESIDALGNKDVQLVYSAHSLPVSFIEDGDPYVDHIKKTISAIEQKINRKGMLCYQSRSGPVEWLSPSTSETIIKLAQEDCKNILMVPISFVSDHVETLYEIEIMFKKEAKDLGIHLEMTKGLNTKASFIQCLKELVLEHC